MAATRDALAERLLGVPEIAPSLYNRMMEDMGYRQDSLKDISKNQQRPRRERKRPGSNGKDQQQSKNNNRMMMMSNMIRLQKEN